jgi:uncharacterized membrane protein
MADDEKKRSPSSRIWLWAIFRIVLGIIGGAGLGGIAGGSVDNVTSSIIKIVLGAVIGGIAGLAFGFLRLYLVSTAPQK